jgi:hypothetical protein
VCFNFLTSLDFMNAKLVSLLRLLTKYTLAVAVYNSKLPPICLGPHSCQTVLEILSEAEVFELQERAQWRTREQMQEN